ncbi:MAG: glycoside hydrolase family 127 protein [Clostridia bacterium]|nr:glycoside hydrolase family 127 protein [Clostridia bacterium]
MKNIIMNSRRLHDEPYRIEKVFRPADYTWQGDWEGRALLAFNCHYEMTGEEIPCMHQMMAQMEEKTNEHGFLGPLFDGVTVNEQQVSGHNWYVRGLIKYAKNFNSELALKLLKSTIENLYQPILPWFDQYPLEREKGIGGVSGTNAKVLNGWQTSSDIGCAYMSVDGLAKYYQLTKDQTTRKLLDKVIETFVATDFVKYGFQTHTTLTCIRGILTMYEATGEEKYLSIVKEKFALYIRHGMTLTYENFNWFGREDTWTEPCAVVDSLILATELYKITNDREYLTLARRIWFNGLQFCQRDHGGAGPNTCITETQRTLKVSMYEAPFCCTMRYAEGLLEYKQNEALFSWDEKAEVVTDEKGRRFVDDKLLVEYQGKLVPIFSCNTFLSKEEVMAVQVTV